MKLRLFLPLSGMLVLILSITSLFATAQEKVCSSMTFTEAAEPLYPPIALAAHVEGPVFLKVSFLSDGRPSEIAVVKGPDFLRSSALTYVRGWHANVDAHTRVCIVELDYGRQNERKSLPRALRISSTHVLINAPQMLIEP